MKKINKFLTLALVCLTLIGLSACGEDDLSTNQYMGGVSLNVFGPSPVARGGILRFLGSGMDKVQSVTIPGCGEITDIDVVSEKEIRVTVPQTAEVGYVTLKTPTGEIVTKTKLTYSEPISVDENGITPNPVKPGKVLTLKGEYLNLIKEVIFSDELPVTEFVVHSRNEIQVVVPEAAQTGDITLADAVSGDEDALRNLIIIKGVEIVLPSVTAVQDITGRKPGDIIIVKGTDLDLVKTVKMPDGTEVEFAYEAAAASTKAEVEVGDGKEKITFTLPDNATDGTVVMIPASGVEVAVATIGMALPEKVKATPAEGLRAGDVITLTGVNMELVTTLTFPGVAEAVEPASKSTTEVKVEMPAAAISGDLLLNTASGTSVPVPIATLKPEFMAFANGSVSLGSDVTIQGKNLDLVVKVIYTGGAEVEVSSSSSTELTVSMPTSGCETGVLTLQMANGETVETASLTINLPEFCYILVLPDMEEAAIKAGTMCQVDIANGDKLTDVQVDGASTQYIVSGDILYFGVPQSAGKSSKVKLVSSNGVVEYDFAFVPATEVEIVLMNTLTDLGTWDEPRVYISSDPFKNLPVSEAKLRIVFAQKADWGQVQINDGNWKNDAVNFPEIGGAYLTTDNAGGKDVTEIELTMDAALIAHFANNNGIVMQGQNWIISKVSIKYEQSLETTIWNGSYTISGWNAFTDYSWGGYDWTTVKAGQTMTIYYTLDATSTYWQMRVAKGDGWQALAGTTDPYDLADTTSLSVVLTQTMVDELINSGGLILTGHGYTMTKITIL